MQLLTFLLTIFTAVTITLALPTLPDTLAAQLNAKGSLTLPPLDLSNETIASLYNATLSKRLDIPTFPVFPSQDNWLNTLKGYTPTDPPYCELGANGNVCTLCTRMNVGQNEAELWLYDHNCVEIGHNPGVPVPSGVGNAFWFASQLPDYVIVYFWNAYLPPSLAYRGVTAGYPATTSDGRNGGFSFTYPGFQLVTTNHFTC